MYNIQEIKQAVVSLPPQEYKEFRRWFLDQDWEKWDQEIEEDVKAGKFDFLIQEATDAKSYEIQRY